MGIAFRDDKFRGLRSGLVRAKRQQLGSLQPLSESQLSRSKLAWGPTEIAATEEMQMQMENGLACASSVIQDGAIAGE